MKGKFNGQQFHQYQLNKQSPLNLIHWTRKKNHDISRWKSFGTGTKIWRS